MTATSVALRATTLADICEEGGGSLQTGPFGSQLHASDYVQSGIPSVMPQNLGNNVIHDEGIARIRPTDAARLSKYLLDEGDIVMSRRGDVTRRAYVQPVNAGWLCGTGCLRVRLGAESPHSARFLSYLLDTEACKGWLVGHAVGATMPNLNTSILGRLPLMMPEPEHQHSASEVLSALDDKIAANASMGSQMGCLAAALFKTWTHGDRQRVGTFGELAAVRGGGTPRTGTTTYWGGDIPWATPTDVTALRGPYLETTERSITEIGLAACASQLYPAGSILMTSRATIGAFAIAQQPTAVNQGFIVVNPHDPKLKWWLFHDMQSRVDEFVALANGATFLELSRGRFKELTVRLPADDVIARFSIDVNALHARARRALLENLKLAELRDTLLPELMSGRMRVKDAEKVVEGVL